MADTKLSALTALAVEMDDADEVYINDGGVSKKQAYSVLKAAFAPALVQNLQTGASYGLVLTDAEKIVELTHGSACGVVIPANAAVAFPVDTRIDIVQGGAGLLTVTITSDTLNGEVVSQGQYKALSLWKKSATVWVIFGGTT